MLPGPTIYRECPSCNKPFTEHSLTSGNTFGAVYWSDGKMDAEMLPEFPAIVKCPDCNNIFWISDATVIGMYDWFRGEDYEEPEEWKKAKSVIDLKIEDYITAIEEKVFSGDDNREEYLRIHLWWLINDLIRYENRQPGLFKQHNDMFRANLKHLDKLLRCKDDDEKLMKAEIARELGEFDLCVNRLEDVSNARGNVCRQINQFVQCKSQIVQRINN
ncbi:hypothetical protein HGB07_00915 [Candidatus Roizmanbacteria bacterium]|nr:hypothetical protein [Candidatus Roizmanbacteria bacterium]